MDGDIEVDFSLTMNEEDIKQHMEYDDDGISGREPISMTSLNKSNTHNMSKYYEELKNKLFEEID